jgi:hypothetical protein
MPDPKNGIDFRALAFWIVLLLCVEVLLIVAA